MAKRNKIGLFRVKTLHALRVETKRIHRYAHNWLIPSQRGITKHICIRCGYEVLDSIHKERICSAKAVGIFSQSSSTLGTDVFGIRPENGICGGQMNKIR